MTYSGLSLYKYRGLGAMQNQKMIKNWNLPYLQLIIILSFDVFVIFSQKGLNHFKIQVSLKLDLFPGFLFQNPFGIWVSSQKESWSSWNSLSP
jgi:hypothetical protein